MVRKMEYKKAEARGLSLALDNTGVCTFIYFPKTKTITVPEKARKAYQCKEVYTDMPYSFAKDFVYMDDQPGFNDMYFKIDAGVQTSTFVFRNHDQTFRCHVTLTTVGTDAVGRPEEVLGIIENESEEMHKTRELNKLVEALSSDCFAVLSVNLSTNEIKLMRTLDGSEYILIQFFKNKHTYQEYVDFCALNLIAPEEQASFLALFNAQKIRQELCKEKTIIIKYKRTHMGIVHNLEAKFVDMSEKSGDSRAVLAYRYIDEEVRKETAYRQVLENTAKAAKLANAAKTDFISRMSHDIRTPLNGIIGMTYIARDEQNPPKTVDCLNKIDLSSKFLLGLINDILDMTKAESGKIELHKEPYNIKEFNDYIEAVIKPLCKEKNQKFVLKEEASNAVFPLCDKLRINQIIFNLLSNAVKYTPEGGTITYTIRSKQIAANKTAIWHIISDTGIGISKEFQKIIFDPFTQERRNDVSDTRGTGLGLAIDKKLVDLMGGTINVVSEEGKGSTFTVNFEFDSIPVETGKGNKYQGEQTWTETSLQGKHVLLCEDHPLNQEIAQTLLAKKGVTVVVAEDGQKGVELFKESIPDFYDAILMDIRMPILNGYEATKAIRALNKADARAIPIIAMTADAFAEDVGKCLAAGMNAHLGKPIEPKQLYETLNKVIADRKRF